jgi:hypothetical protein
MTDKAARACLIRAEYLGHNGTDWTASWRAHSGDPERSNRLIMNTHSGDHEHRLARA